MNHEGISSALTVKNKIGGIWFKLFLRQGANIISKKRNCNRDAMKQIYFYSFIRKKVYLYSGIKQKIANLVHNAIEISFILNGIFKNETRSC